MPSKAAQRRRPPPPPPEGEGRGWSGRRWLAALVPLALVGALFWWLAPAGASSVPHRPGAAAAAGGAAEPPPQWPALAGQAKPAQGDPAGRPAQLAQWRERLERAQQTLASYRESTRYPHESRPIAEQTDQVYPNRPVGEEGLLKTAGGQVDASVSIKTSQSRVFVAGGETVQFTVAARDRNGNPLPLTISRAVARGLPQPGVNAQLPQLALAFADAGSNGDAVAGDGVLSTLLAPGQTAFAQFDGGIRVELSLRIGEREGYHFFDIYYTPQPPALWAGPVREAQEGGSLVLYLPVEVRVAGRYLASGRIDDAQGKPFALASFNEELAAGPQQIKLTVFGKLIRDGRPAFPLALRDVEAYQLRESYPDRALLPRLAGVIHTTRSYSPASFSDAEWSSEERARYLAEYGKDVAAAQEQVNRLSEGSCQGTVDAGGNCVAQR
ncbi:hypothetical protein [Chitinimonas koreensis]|uniref:hypothetical protein n=1 Tax=Chitinimonas koreensis TaxID=356302 RepID=UPI0003F5F0BB|nr:hypothetical protein [Chitinimonas koreensis]QNM96654.1 hypothetical protein H9L41_23380 [Chitinimonas koreensis]